MMPSESCSNSERAWAQAPTVPDQSAGCGIRTHVHELERIDSQRRVRSSDRA